MTERVLSSEMCAAGQTVLDVADHFGELKTRALALIGTSGATDRGFFTPTEDLQVRQLQISYWTSRNALIELITTFHETDTEESPERRERFLVAFAGALVLIDAARFLREHFHARHVVRDKLNEPEPQFGIPAGTYNRIQRSLTSPVHAWHLYHALRYYHDHEQELRGLGAENATVHDVIRLIEALRERIDVSLGELAVAQIRARSRSLRTRVTRDLLKRALYGLQKSVSRLLTHISVVRGHEPGLPPEVQRELSRLLQPGDVLVTRKEFVATNYFLPGFWPHAALFAGDAEHLRRLGLADRESVQPHWRQLLDNDAGPSHVVESMKDGVRVRPLSVPLQCDAIAVVRPVLNETEIARALERAFRHVGKPYDFDFDLSRSDRLVCTEVVYRAYEGIAPANFDVTRRVGRFTLSAEDILQMSIDGTAFRPVAAFAAPHVGQLVTDGEAAALIRRTMGTP